MIDVWPFTRSVSVERARERAEAEEALREASRLLEQVEKHGDRLAEAFRIAIAGRRPNGQAKSR